MMPGGAIWNAAHSYRERSLRNLYSSWLFSTYFSFSGMPIGGTLRRTISRLGSWTYAADMATQSLRSDRPIAVLVKYSLQKRSCHPPILGTETDASCLGTLGFFLFCNSSKMTVPVGTPVLGA